MHRLELLRPSLDVDGQAMADGAHSQIDSASRMVAWIAGRETAGDGER